MHKTIVWFEHPDKGKSAQNLTEYSKVRLYGIRLKWPSGYTELVFILKLHHDQAELVFKTV